MSEVNMHMHSYYSDGKKSPTEIVKEGKRAGLKAIVLTDHDVYQGLPEFLAAAKKHNIDTMTGIEITSTYKDCDVHILGYGFDLLKEEFLKKKLFAHWEMRNKRAEQTLDKYRNAGIMYASVEDVRNVINIQGPYVATTDIREYRAKDSGLSYDQVKFETKRGGIARSSYIINYLMSPAEVVKFINVAGGRAVLAHPGELSKRTDKKGVDGNLIFRKLLDDLQDAGLFGLEAYYINHSPKQVKYFLRTAKKRNLFVTAGSDYHGEDIRKISLKTNEFTYEDFKKFKKSI